MVRELGSERKLHCVLPLKSGKIRVYIDTNPPGGGNVLILTNIGETLIKLIERFEGQYRGKMI